MFVVKISVQILSKIAFKQHCFQIICYVSDRVWGGLGGGVRENIQFSVRTYVSHFVHMYNIVG